MFLSSRWPLHHEQGRNKNTKAIAVPKFW